ncbi:sigma-54-dependent Fis family transcriptional regulator [Tardiphaga sp.]|uniref:sigma-54-dependent Fis family transcriptional regulator n=1 Tax=Tardiphaga sp. TaxID=1926292 RepID=UPI00352A9B3E
MIGRPISGDGIFRNTFQLMDDQDSVVSKAWENFVSGVGLEQSPVRDVVIDSWQRCRHSNVKLSVDVAPHLGGDVLGSLRRKNRELLQAAAATLAEAADVLAGTSSLMLITDPMGVVLESVGDRKTVHAGMDIALSQGGQWQEGAAGTNGIGTALAIDRAVMVHAGEHYCEGIKSWSCAGAPIHDPVDGSIVGILDISAKRQESSAQIFALAVVAASQIEQALMRETECQQLRLMEMGLEHSQRHAGDGLIAIDAKGRIAYMSRLAQRMLGERIECAVPELKRGMQLLDSSGRPISKLVPSLPSDWLRPLIANGDVTGHLLVIPSRTAAKAAPVIRVVTDETDPARSQFDSIVGVSESIRHAIAQAKQVAALNVPVLIEGETGVGKELFARAIHGQSGVARGPFVPFNCGAVSKEMLASELFGYAKGAFTGANVEGRIGRFEQADGGTLCLDEIGELQLELQPYLLRVLEEGVIYRVGDNRPRRINVRVLAMTNRDLRAEVAAGRFRLDLYHRLSVTAIEVPPLRLRPGDLDCLIDYFNPRVADRHAREPARFTEEAMSRLRAYTWPGNIRELRNVVERGILFAHDGIADVACLPREIAASEPLVRGLRPPMVDHGADESRSLGSAEQAAINDAMRVSGGNLSVAASMLGISRSTLYRKMSQHGLKRVVPLYLHGRFGASPAES